jgi:hypothetical protein
MRKRIAQKLNEAEYGFEIGVKEGIIALLRAEFLEAEGPVVNKTTGKIVDVVGERFMI